MPNTIVKQCTKFAKHKGSLPNANNYRHQPYNQVLKVSKFRSKFTCSRRILILSNKVNKLIFQCRKLNSK